MSRSISSDCYECGLDLHSRSEDGGCICSDEAIDDLASETIRLQALLDSAQGKYQALVDAAYDVVGMEIKTIGSLTTNTGVSAAIFNLDKALKELGNV